MKTQRGDGMLGFCPHLVQLRQQGWQLYELAALYESAALYELAAL